MGTQAAIVTYAIKDEETGQWEFYSEFVEPLTIHWLAMKKESLHGKGRFVLFNETHIESDEIGLGYLRDFFETPSGLPPTETDPPQ